MISVTCELDCSGPGAAPEHTFPCFDVLIPAHFSVCVFCVFVQRVTDAWCACHRGLPRRRRPGSTATACRRLWCASANRARCRPLGSRLRRRLRAPPDDHRSRRLVYSGQPRSRDRHRRRPAETRSGARPPSNLPDFDRDRPPLRWSRTHEMASTTSSSRRSSTNSGVEGLNRAATTTMTTVQGRRGRSRTVARRWSGTWCWTRCTGWSWPRSWPSPAGWTGSRWFASSASRHAASASELKKK